MSSHPRRLGEIISATALVVLVGLGTVGIASGKKAKPLKVSCDQLYAEIDKTGAQLEAQYNARGFTIGVTDPEFPGDPAIDGFTHKGACQKQGKRVRMDGGFMNDVHTQGAPPF